MFGVEKGVAFPITATDQFSGQFDKLKGSVTGISGEFAKLSGLIAAVTGGVGIAIFGRFIKDSLEAQDSLSKLSQKLNITVEVLAGLQHAADLSGVSTEGLTKGLKSLATQIFDASSGLLESKRNFAALQVEIRNTDGSLKSTEAVMLEVSDRFAAMQDGTEKTALAVKLFGRAGLDMIPMLNMGRNALAEMIAEGQRLNPVTTESARLAEIFNDNITRLQKSVSSIAVSFLNDLLPVLSDLSKIFAEEALAGDLKKTADGMDLLSPKATFLGEALKALVIAGGNVSFVLKGVGDTLGAIAAAQTHFMSGNLKGVLDVFSSWRAEGAAARVEFDAWEKKILAVGKGLVDFVGDTGLPAVTKHFRATVEEVGKATKAMKDLGLADEHVTAWLKKMVAEAKLANDEVQRAIDLDEQARLAKEGAIQSFREHIEQMEFEVTLLGKSNAERQVAIALRQLEKAGIDATNPSLEAYVNRIREAVSAQEAFRNQHLAVRDDLSVWDEASNAAGSFFSDLVMNGKSAFDNLKRYVKDLLAQMIQIFATRWVLQLGAAATGSTALAAQAGQVGQGSLAGSVLSYGANALNFGLAGAGAGAGALAGDIALGWAAGSGAASTGAGSFGVLAAGETSTLGMAGMGAEWVAGLSSTGWGLIIVAAVAVVAALISGNRTGGPKLGGSFFGEYDASGQFVGDRSVPGTDNGRFFTPAGGDSGMRQFTDSVAEGFFSTLQRWGGTSSGMQFGFGFDQDPQGSADSRVTAMVRGAGGQTLLDSTVTAGRDDEDFQRALGLQSSRSMLAALQGSVLADGIEAILSMLDAATATAEQIDALFSLADAFAILTDALSTFDPGSVIADASRSAADIFTAQGRALTVLASRTTLTTESLGALTQATYAYRQSAAQLIVDLESAKLQIGDMFGQTGRNIRLAGLDRQGQYDFYQSEADRLYEQIGSATTADEVSRLASQINADIQAAFGLTSPEQQVSMQQDWLTRLDAVNTTVQDRLGALQEAAAAQTNETLTRIEAMMERLAADQAAAADRQLSAAATQQVAADTPRTLNLNVNVESGSVIVTDGG